MLKIKTQFCFQCAVIVMTHVLSTHENKERKEGKKGEKMEMEGWKRRERK